MRTLVKLLTLGLASSIVNSSTAEYMDRSTPETGGINHGYVSEPTYPENCTRSRSRCRRREPSKHPGWWGSYREYIPFSRYSTYNYYDYDYYSSGYRKSTSIPDFFWFLIIIILVVAVIIAPPRTNGYYTYDSGYYSDAELNVEPFAIENTMSILRDQATIDDGDKSAIEDFTELYDSQQLLSPSPPDLMITELLGNFADFNEMGFSFDKENIFTFYSKYKKAYDVRRMTLHEFNRRSRLDPGMTDFQEYVFSRRFDYNGQVTFCWTIREKNCSKIKTFAQHPNSRQYLKLLLDRLMTERIQGYLQGYAYGEIRSWEKVFSKKESDNTIFFDFALENQRSIQANQIHSAIEQDFNGMLKIIYNWEIVRTAPDYSCDLVEIPRLQFDKLRSSESNLLDTFHKKYSDSLLQYGAF